jgi:hypothetical protein
LTDNSYKIFNNVVSTAEENSTKCHRTIIMNGEKVRIWEETVIIYSRYYPDICLELEETTSSLCKGSRYLTTIQPGCLLNAMVQDVYL